MGGIWEEVLTCGASIWCFPPYFCLFICHTHIHLIHKTHSKAVWPLASNKDLVIKHWWLTRVFTQVWRGYWGKHFSFNYTTVSRRVSCHSLVFQAWAELLQIREQCDSAEMLHCGETWSGGCTAADPFMDFKYASHIWVGDENMQIIWESLSELAHPGTWGWLTHKVAKKMIWKHDTVKSNRDYLPFMHKWRGDHPKMKILNVCDHFVCEIVTLLVSY